MKKVVLISCVSNKKSDGVYPACQLYAGPLFQNSFEYAQGLKPEMIHILSAKYKLISYKEPIASYNTTLNDMKDQEIQEWSTEVLKQLNDLYDIENTNFIILAGSNYYEYLIPNLKNYELPCGKLPIGKRIQWLQRENRKRRRS